MIEYFKDRLFMCVCVQTLLIWYCDHGRIPHHTPQCIVSLLIYSFFKNKQYLFIQVD